jgi:hypothetical protein
LVRKAIASGLFKSYAIGNVLANRGSSHHGHGTPGGASQLDGAPLPGKMKDGQPVGKVISQMRTPMPN